MSLGLGDVSGTLGLLWPASDKLADQKAAAFERLLADAIQWLLANETFDSSHHNVVLLQGPLIPKLRGRLLYRGISTEVPIYTTTYQTEWFKRIEAAQITFEFLPRATNKEPVVGSLYPPRGIDCSTRSWVCASAMNDPFHFEIIANSWDCCKEPDWLTHREQDIKSLLGRKILIETDKGIPLPGPLAKATELVQKIRQREQEYLRLARFFRDMHDVDPTKLKNLSKNFPAFTSKQFPLGESNVPQHESLPFEAAASYLPIAFDEEAAYQWYKQNHTDTTVAEQVKRILRKTDAPHGLQ